MEQILRNANGDLVRAEVDEVGSITRVIEVLERAAETQGIAAAAAAAEHTRTVLAHVSGQTPDTRALDDDAGTIGLTNNEISQFSFLRAVNAMMNPGDRSAQAAAGFEFEASRAAEQSSGRTAQGIMVPVDVLTRALNTSSDGLAPGNTGGFFVDTTLMTQSFIQLLRNRSIFLQMATPLGGLVGNYDIPGQAASGNVFWVGEGLDVGEGAFEGRNVSMSPKTIGVYGEVTRRMRQSGNLATR